MVIQTPLELLVKNFIGKKKLKIERVLKEALVNSIQAKAQNIEVVFTTKKNYIKNSGKYTITEITIADDGEGFTEHNRKSFDTYLSEYKKEQGCKGVGRLSYLAVFDKVKIESLLPNSKVTCDFDINYNDKDRKFKTDKTTKHDKTSTTIKFSSIKTTETLEIDKLAEDLKYHMLDLLYLKKEKGKTNINITFCINEKKNEVATITNTGLEFETPIKFTISKGELFPTNFKLHYSITEDKNLKDGENIYQYCANHRGVHNFKGYKPPLIKEYRIILYVTSEYLDKDVNDDRTKFKNIPNSNKGTDNRISFSDIDKEIEKKMETIFSSPEFNTIFDVARTEHEGLCEELRKKHPYLEFVHSNKYETDETVILKQARKKFTDEQAKYDKILLEKSKKEITEKKKEGFQNLMARELVSYIFHRQAIIEFLQKEVEKDKKEGGNEDTIHRTLYSKKTDSKTGEIDIRDNNLWILDDRFMYCNYVASDIILKTIIEHINEEIYKMTGKKAGQDSKSKLKPDLFTAYFDKNKSNCVCIELKATNLKNNDKNEKTKQMHRYIRRIKNEFKNRETKITFWYYYITTIDEDLELALEDDDYELCFVGKAKSYYKYLKKLDTTIYAISFKDIIQDAKERNEVFLEIMKNTNLDSNNTCDSEKNNTCDSEQSNTDDSEQSNTDDSEQSNTDDSEKNNPSDSEKNNTDDSEKNNTCDSEQSNTDDSEKNNTNDSEQSNTNDSEQSNTDDSEKNNTDDSEKNNTCDSEKNNTDDSENNNTCDSENNNPSDSEKNNTDDSEQGVK